MAFITGTATDYHDLLDDLRAWLVGTVGWTQLAYTAPASITDQAELYLRGPGAGAGRQVFVNIQTFSNVPNAAYGWKIRGATAYDVSLGFDAQENVSPEIFYNTWQFSMPYWFYANDRRFIVVARVSSSDVSCYCGFFLPFATPDEYAQPLYVGANYPILEQHDIENTRNRMIADPGSDTAYFLTRGGSTWRGVTNHLNATTAISIQGGERSVLWPFRTPRADSNPDDNDWNNNGISDLRPNLNGELPLWTVHIINPEDRILMGALDGVYAAPGFNRTSQQVLTQGGQTFRIFQNIFRTTDRDFMGIEEI